MSEELVKAMREDAKRLADDPNFSGPLCVLTELESGADLIERQSKIIDDMERALAPFHNLWASQPPASGTYWKCPRIWCEAAYDAVTESARSLTNTGER